MSDSVTPWTVAHQAPLSMGFSGPEYWIGLPLPSPGDLVVNADMEPKREWIEQSLGPNISHRQDISNSRFFVTNFLSQIS